MKVADVKKKYKNTWVLAEVLKENALNQVIDVRPILASKDRDEIYEKIAQTPKNKTVTTFYTGKISDSFLFLHDY